VLLNLLIAIMGDTFDRVKFSANAHLTMARASFVDECEAGLTPRQAENLKSAPLSSDAPVSLVQAAQ